MTQGLDFNGRSGGIRTRDPLLPKQMRYQAALRSDNSHSTPTFTLFRAWTGGMPLKSHVSDSRQRPDQGALPNDGR